MKLLGKFLINKIHKKYDENSFCIDRQISYNHIKHVFQFMEIPILSLLKTCFYILRNPSTSSAKITTHNPKIKQ